MATIKAITEMPVMNVQSKTPLCVRLGIPSDFIMLKVYVPYMYNGAESFI